MPDMTREGDERAVRERSPPAATAFETIERAKVREVAGVLPSRAALDASVEELLLAGFDRADIDVLDGLERAREKIGSADIVADELVDVPQAPRSPYLAPEDITVTDVVVVSTLASTGALAAAFVVVGSGGGFGWAMIAAAGAAVIAGGVGALVMMRVLRQRPEALSEALEALMATHGFLLWVRVRTPEQEHAAKYILMGHGAQAVRVHEIEIVKRPDEIPLSSLRPDPWLGDERLGGS
jgi:hypothetical protein